MGREIPETEKRTNDVSNSQFGIFWICLLLIIITITTLWKVPLCEFIGYDDDRYIFEEKNVTAGLSWRSVVWAFTSEHADMWHPLTSLSHIIDYQLFKDKPFGHHLVNLLLHTANVVILFLILKTMTNSVWSSAFVAALFAIHPIQIESVAWVSERKNLMSGFFWMLTIAAYIRYARKPAFSRYLFVILVFCLAIMSKPIVVTLPFVLLLLDYWPLRRIKLFDTDLKTILPRFPTVSFKLLIPEKIPLLILAALLSVITFVAQKRGQVVRTLDAFPLKARIFNAIFSYVKYIEKMFYPTKLSIFYPHPLNKLTVGIVVISAVFLLTVSIIVVRMAKSHKYLFVGWLWYIGMMVPVIGLVQAGAQAMADRYAYLSFIGLYIIVAWGVPDLLSQLPSRKIILVSLSLPLLFVLSVYTSFQLRYWQNPVDLFEHAVKVTEDNYIMHNSLCGLYSRLNNLDKSIEHGKKAVLAKPDYAVSYYNLGLSLYQAGQIDKAIECWEKNIALGSKDINAHINLGYLYYNRNRIDLATKHFQSAIEIDDHFFAHAVLGRIMADKGNITQAFYHYERSLKSDPNQSEIRFDYASLLENHNKLEEAIKQYQLVLKFDPEFEKAREALKIAIQKQSGAKTP